MGFRDLLKEKLKGKIDLDLDKLPTGFQRIGDVIIINLDKSFYDNKKDIGNAILEIFKVRSVCNKFGEIKGEFREPQIEVIAGSDNTVVTNIENGVKYKFDIGKIMFAKGNLNERARYPKIVKKGEIVIDMFAGIGYFSLPIAKLSNAEKIYSIELNPVSFNFFKENIKLNNVSNIEAIHGDNRIIIDKLVEEGIKADRVLMGYLPPPKEFLPWAFKIINKNGFLHYEDILTVGKEVEESEKVMKMISNIAENYGFKIELINLQDVKSYGPKKHHYVFDILVKRF